MKPLSSDTQLLLLLSGFLEDATGKARPPERCDLGTWRRIESASRAEGLEGPGDLLRAPARVLRSVLSHVSLDVEWVESRLARSVELALHLERLDGKGVWVTAVTEDTFPRRIALALGDSAPLYFFGAGDASIANDPGIGFVGSRDMDAESERFTRVLARKCVAERFVIVSGGAKGVDRTAQASAIDSGGRVVVFPTEGINVALRNRDQRNGVLAGAVVALSAFAPDVKWSVGLAMARNRFIHALSRYCVVVAARKGEGGTWAGATENLRHQWSPLLVRAGPGAPEGNLALVEAGGVPLAPEAMDDDTSLRDLLRQMKRKAAAPSRAAAERADRTGPPPAPEPPAPLSDLHDARTPTPPVPPALAQDGHRGSSPGKQEQPVQSELFPLVWPHVERAWHASGRDEAKAAQSLGVTRPQLRLWMKHAREHGLLPPEAQRTKPKRGKGVPKDKSAGPPNRDLKRLDAFERE